MPGIHCDHILDNYALLKKRFLLYKYSLKVDNITVKSSTLYKQQFFFNGSVASFTQYYDKVGDRLEPSSEVYTKNKLVASIY